MGTLPQLIEEDIATFERSLAELLEKSEAQIALLIDKGGFLISQIGNRAQDDTTTLAALAAASFAATASIANLVGETDFDSVYQQGKHFSLLVENVDEHCLLTVVFKAQVSAGAVKYFAQSTILSVAAQLRSARQRNPQAGLDLAMANLADTKPLFTRKQT